MVPVWNLVQVISDESPQLYQTCQDYSTFWQEPNAHSSLLLLACQCGGGAHQAAAMGVLGQSRLLYFLLPYFQPWECTDLLFLSLLPLSLGWGWRFLLTPFQECCLLFIDGDCAVHSYRRNRFQLCTRSISSDTPWGIKRPISFTAIAGNGALPWLLPTQWCHLQLQCDLPSWPCAKLP